MSNPSHPASLPSAHGRRATIVIAAIAVSVPAVSAADDPFETPWLGFNVGSSAHAGATAPKERDPVCMTTADFDGDGRVDVAVGNYEYAAPGGGTDGMSGFAVIFGEGDRRFSPPMHVTVSNQGCWGIDAADFDNDGDPDIAVSIANTFWNGTRVRIYLNDGTGSFPTFTTRFVADGPIGITAADLDGDGNVDLAVANYQWPHEVGLVSVLLGDGTGALAEPVEYAVEWFPWSIVAGDVDGDGDMDLAVGHQEQTVSVLRNAGDGTFPDVVAHTDLFPPQGGTSYGSVAIADGDGDGDLDLFYTNTRAGQPAILDGYVVHLVNDGLGGFTRAADIPATAGVDLIADDVDGDAWPDLVVVEHSARVGDGPHVLFNDGAGGFGESVQVSAGQGTFAVALADADQDGDPDLLTTDRYSMAVTVHENLGGGAFPEVPLSVTDGTAVRTDAGDVDGDGDLDVFVSGESFGVPGALSRNRGDGTFEAPVSYTHSTTYGRGVSRAKLRDLDGDGDLDLLYNGAHTDFHDGYNFYTAANDGTGTFGPIVQWVISTCGNGDVNAFDLDEDGDLDVINCEELACAGSESANRLYVSLNHGDGTFAPAYTIDIDTGPHQLIGGDYNEDGHVDLITTHWMPYGWRDFINVHLGNGDGTFQEELRFQTGQGCRQITQGDFDGDGHVDLATANTGHDNIEGSQGRETMTVLFGTGTGSFSGRTDYYLPYSSDLLGSTGITAGDVDQDGDLDILATTVAGGMACYENDGTGAFSFTIRYGIRWDPWAPLYDDFDGDGIRDLVATARDPELPGGAALAFLRGTGAVTVAVPATAPAPAGILSAVAPNPLRAYGRFDVRVPSTGPVEVAVYDVSGRRVATLADGVLEAGVRHVFTIDGRGLPGGVYFVRAEGASFDLSRRIVVAR